MGRTKPTDYSKLVIYKIRCNDESVLDFYVGSTTNFRSRKYDHKRYTETRNQKIYEIIRANGGWKNWTMVELELYSCNSFTEARIREEYWRETLQSNMNQRRAYCTEELRIEQQAHYYQDHKEELAVKNAQYYQAHKEQIAEKGKEKYDCPCGSTLRISDKSTHEKSKKHYNFVKRQCR